MPNKLEKILKNKNNKIFIFISSIIILILLAFLLFFGFKQYQIYQAKQKTTQINKILNSKQRLTLENCKTILNFNKNLVDNINKYLNEILFDKTKEECNLKYNIANINLEEKVCKEIIKKDKKDFENKYIILDEFEKVKNKCTKKYLKINFSTGSFFDVENDFKSSISINFSLDFFEDKYKEGSKAFIENRTKAKQRLLSLLEIEPKVNLSVDDIILYKRKAILYLDLKPNTEYKFKLKSIDFGVGEKTKNKEFVLKTPDNKFFGFKINKKVTLFPDKMQPKFTFYKYNIDKKEAKLRICRIDNENYTKIEVFDSFPNIKQKKEFFKNGIDKIKTFECKTKILKLENKTNSGTTNKNILIKKEFDFSKEIGNPARSGLYYITFDNPKDREFNGRIQKPIFFGIIDSHITMKIGANNSAFFFVNDFNGNPLDNQEIRVYLNNFKSQKKEHHYENGKYIEKITYYSPLEKNVLSKPIYLGKTDKNGVLNVNLKGKIDDAFDRTLNSWNYNWDGNLNSLFVTSASKTNLSYVSSKYNGGITPWNFGYSIGSWWGGNRSENQDQITLQTWIDQKKLLSHIFTDRKLYLPGEEVYLKAILRDAGDLSIPKNKKVKLIVRDSKNKEIVNLDFITNDYGSINHSIKLPKTAPLGNYFIELQYNNENIGNSGFSVEVFKNPKFKTDITLETDGLNKNLVKITSSKTKYNYGWEEKTYIGNFKIKAKIISKYYSGPFVKNAKFSYKVYKQDYYDDSYWDDCYYGCFWEPEKELYTQGTGVLDENGSASFEIPIKFESSYNDYKYIVEVTITDKAGDTISSSNSIIAKLPDEYKTWNPNSGIKIETQKRFYKTGENIVLKARLNNGKFRDYYNDKFLLIIKRKDYENKEILDIRGKKINIPKPNEIVEKIIKINTTNFKLNPDGSLTYIYKAPKTGEYVFEYGKVNKNYFLDSQKIINYFQNKINSQEQKAKSLYITGSINKNLKVNYYNFDNLLKYCDPDSKTCDRKEILKIFTCQRNYIDNSCRNKEVLVKQNLKIKVDDLIDPDSRKYFTIIVYGDLNAKNPIVNDNKIQILSEKISYHIGEKARILIRLPKSDGKILLTTEKKSIVKSELIPVKGNIFFKEFIVDDSFAPNSYIGAVFIPKFENGKIPEYKVGYTEIVVDKTDKKAFINIKTNKKQYKPREKVSLDILVKNKAGKAVKSELTVMVVDDSLISLIGNVDLNTLEKFYKKLPFSIQTAITNIAMLRNYYFTRRGIVGGSGFGNFKGGDSAVSSRNIFKNTAYYNPSVITDYNGKAHIEFNLPDNLTNFRIMVVSNSKKNFFGYASKFIEVRKNVIVQDKTPIILRHNDKSVIGAQVFNNTKKKIGFKVELNSQDVEVKNKTQNIVINPGESKYVSWEIKVPPLKDKINYKISALGDSADNSDAIENSIEIKTSPVIITNNIKNINIPGANNTAGIIEENIKLGDNVDIQNSKVEILFSNNKLVGIENIVSSLAAYPYGCIEQTISSTLPNAIVLRFSKLFSGIIKNELKARENLKAGIKRLKSMQLENGAFTYWQGGNDSAGIEINSYVLRSLIEMKKVYNSNELDELIRKNIGYLKSQFNTKNLNTSEKIQIFYALTKAGENINLNINSDNLSKYDLILYTNALVLKDKIKFKEQIEKNISKLKDILEKDDSYAYYYYSSNLNNKALLANLLLDYEYNRDYTDSLIFKLYNRDWLSYYYSTKTKANTFLAFAKYLEKYSVKNTNKFGFSIGNILNLGKVFYVGGNNNFIKKIEYNLSDILEKGKDNFDIKIANLSKNKLFAQVIVKQYPKDILKVKPYSNRVKVKREIYEVLDESKISECTDYWLYYYKKKDNKNCDKVLKLVTNNIYKKGHLYRVKITTSFDDSRWRNFVVEDYLPGTFRVINSSFKTESALIKQNTKNNNWSWEHIEYSPNVVMANTDYIRNNQKEFSYYVRPEFAGKYTQPPVTAYFMYNPLYRANSEFNIIEVK